MKFEVANIKMYSNAAWRHSALILKYYGLEMAYCAVMRYCFRALQEVDQCQDEEMESRSTPSEPE